MKAPKGGKHPKRSRFKKTGLVYAVVGAACCNSAFRAQLFAKDPGNDGEITRFIGAFMRATGMGNRLIEPRELEMIKSFIDKRSIKAKHRKVLKKALGGPIEEITFETACETFALQVCPFWPCDDYSPAEQ